MDNRNILIIEDDPAVARSTQRMLSRSGFGVFLAESGESGEQTLQGNSDSVDTVLVDYTLPGANGIEVITRLRALYPHLHFFLMSGHSPEYFPEALPREYLAGFIQKPFAFSQLVSTIRQISAESPNATA